ncbi:hypothetical protein Ato02nite_001990 [Paractinoplanes toevensis]|uniref:Uncharacterized protein n=2 Tax=Paractinoplanes toevensis TaxID=571911 RepID=A0A919T6D0_9ACTN|nr:hypothetical protein Ato02nite_001990 [Actinoplanes toevensis]
MVMAAGAAGPVSAAPPAHRSDPAGNWSVADGRLTWQSDKPVPMGDAAVEFWSGDTLLGRPRPLADGRTFRLDLGQAKLGDLSVRAGGKRLDQAPPAAAAKRAAPATAPALGTANPVDPGVKGPFRTISGEYDLPGVKLPDFPENVEMRAVVVAPKGAPGARPLALFLHGRHTVCFHGTDEDVPQEWPCPAGTDPIPSYRGYLQAQELLASQGYVTVSISANGINGQDFASDDGGAQARSSLVRLHLARWADWAGSGRAGAPAIVRAAPRADLSKVFLMGHSRGGEGVSRAAMDTLTPPPAAQDGYHGKVRWTIRGLLLIGPTIFGHDPVPDVPSATILPGCDGDVFDLQGQMFVDETRGVSRGKALHSALYVIGANHNFFNTEWTPGQSVAPSFDDFFSGDEPDPVCSPGTPTRLTAPQQQNVGATYIAAAARLFVAGDDRVRPLLDGSGARARSADPARVLSHALGARRDAVLTPDPTVRVSAGARICEQVTRDAAASCLDPEDINSGTGHFTWFGPVIPEPGRYAAALNWSAAGTPIRLTPARPVSVAGDQALALRVIVPPNSTGTRFGVTAVGPDGRRTTLGDVRIDGLPGTELTTSYWGQEVRVPLRGTRTVAAVELTPRTATGSAWVLDAWGWNPGTPNPQETGLPRIDIGSLVVVEGDSGTKTYRVPVNITGRGAGVVRLFQVDSNTYESTSWLATVRPGDRSITVPVEVAGDILYGEDENQYILAKAEKGVVIGDWIGGVEVQNDDPEPVVTVEPVADRVAEGGTLSWRFSLSAPTETWFYVVTEPHAPTGGAELSTTDVDPEWFEQNAYEPVEPSRPLSSTYLTPYVFFDPGVTTAELTVPTVTDGLTEPDEAVELHFVYGYEGPPLTGVVTGG